ncbi:uncharacterized protein LOC133528536 [Cydia pomonella]|uniref:uncharacterized protein LOC133528536 n=1 Tax=Cydia pomonella TaxID=82600 RepID=UPI002ADDC52F|nr:uncharacterized protein LOC133528536 [Cydia pomonella]
MEQTKNPGLSANKSAIQNVTIRPQTDQITTTTNRFSTRPNQTSTNQKKDAFYYYKKKLRTEIVKATEKIDELTKLELRASTSFLEAKKPMFSCWEQQHPLNFLEILNIHLKNIPKEDHLDTAFECLEGFAKDWAGANKSYWSNIDEFKKSFIIKFWGKSAQNSLRRKIVSGCYSDEDESMSKYFINLISQARWLPNKIPDEELIADIMNHFTKQVYIGWHASKKSTVLEAVEYLRKLDEIEMLSDLKENSQRRNINCKYRLRIRENVSDGNKTSSGDLVNYQHANKKMKRDL